MATQTLTTLKAHVRDAINDASTTIISDTEIGAIINDGFRDVASKTMCYEATKTITLIAGTASYRIPATTQTAMKIVYVDHNNRGLIHSLPTVIGRFGTVTSGMGTPQHWTQWGDVIVVDPPPDASAAAVSPGLTLFCSCYPTTSITSSIPDIPVEFHECIWEYASAFSHMKYKMWGDVANWYNRYIDSLQRRRFEYIMKVPDPRSVSEVPKSVTYKMDGGQ